MFGIDDALIGAVAAPLVGAAIGGLTGGKKKNSTATSMPALPAWLEQDYKDLVGRGKKLADTPFAPTPTSRVAAPTTGFDALFANPELLQIQQGADQKYLQDMMNPAPAPVVAAPAAPPAGAQMQFYQQQLDNLKKQVASGLIPQKLGQQQVAALEAKFRGMQPSSFSTPY